METKIIKITPKIKVKNWMYRLIQLLWILLRQLIMWLSSVYGPRMPVCTPDNIWTCSWWFGRWCPGGSPPRPGSGHPTHSQCSLVTCWCLVMDLPRPDTMWKVPWVRWLLTFWDAVSSSACCMHCLLSRHTSISQEICCWHTVSLEINTLHQYNTAKWCFCSSNN